MGIRQGCPHSPLLDSPTVDCLLPTVYLSYSHSLTINMKFCPWHYLLSSYFNLWESHLLQEFPITTFTYPKVYRIIPLGSLSCHFRVQYIQNCIHPLSVRLVFLNLFQYPAILPPSKFKTAVFFNFFLCYSHFHNPISSSFEKISQLLLLLYYSFFYLTSDYHLHYFCQNYSQCVTVFYSMAYSTKF